MKFFKKNTIDIKQIGVLWEKEGKSEEHKGEPYLSGTINKENVLIFHIPKTEHYFDEFAPDWAIFSKNNDTSGRDIKKYGSLYIEDIDGKIEEIENNNFIKNTTNYELDKEILKNTKLFTGIYKDIKIVVKKNINKINNQPDWLIFKE